MESVQMIESSKKPIKFNSFMGFAMNAAKDGEKVSVAFQMNCKDNNDEATKSTIGQNILTDFIYPEIQRRVKEGKVDAEFKPYKVHLLMYSDETRNEILLNDDVRIKGLVKFRDGISPTLGQIIKGEDIEDILGLYPNEKNDPNAAHIMLVRTNNKWHFACDLIYDKERVRKRFDTAKEFLKVAEFCFKEKLWGPLCDNLFSAAELTVQSILLIHHNPFFSTNQDHEKTRELFTNHAENGNTDVEFAKNHTKLWELRKQGRYLTGVNKKNFTIEENEAQKLLDITKRMIEETEKLFKQVNFDRKTPAGNYVDFGIS
jgi:uncharacterized protein (UPF0332 family)